MYLSEFTVKSLIDNIEKVLGDQLYIGHMQKASDVLRDQPISAAEKASYLIKHVIKHGDKHLKTGAHQLSFLQYYMFDIFLFIWFVLIACSVLLITCCYCLCRSVSSRIGVKGKFKTA